MKNITDYFSSPSDKRNKPVEDDTTLETQESKVDSGTCLKEDIKVISLVENSSADSVKPVRQKKSRKSKKRKPSDPAVRNITDLFSNNVNIISPNASFTAVVEPVVVESIDSNSAGCNGEAASSSSKDELSTQNSQSNSSYVDNQENEQQKCKVNAFQFMMNSRNKSIGQNSQGKLLSEDEDDAGDKSSKDKSLTRRSVLQNWAEKKGAAKRKREEEERDEVITYKLNKRAKRLKKLLQIDTIKDDGDDFNEVFVKKKKRIKRVSTSSESSKDVLEKVDDSKEVLQSPVLELIEENAQSRVLNGNKIKGTKSGLLNFLGVVNNTKKDKKENIEIEVIDVDEPITKTRKKKFKRNLENEAKKPKEVVIVEESTEEKPIIVQKSKTPKRKNKVDESSQESKSKTSKIKILSDSENSSTPRSLKSWKMKIKINMEDNASIENGIKGQRTVKTKRKSSLRQAHVISDESSNEGKINVLPAKQNKTLEDDIVLSSESDSDFNEKKTVKKPSKLAPIFIKATPKPKVDPEALEARKQFLMSGIPSSLKKTIEKQHNIDEREYDIFPVISHVQQKCETQPFWTLPNPKLNLTEYSPLKASEPKICSRITNSHIVSKVNIKTEVEKVDKLKTLLNKIKADNPAYPVYKSFRLIYEKSGLDVHENQDKKRKRNKKRHSKTSEKPSEVIKQDGDSAFAMWTDKYKPKCSDDIIGNSEAVKNLKKWLEIWINFSKEINARKKRRREASTSESEFDTTDCDSRDSTKLPGNTVVLGGPCGSGKSAAVYAICNELGFNVIELNASSKRTGKLLLQKLQEATQSHQVRKNEQSSQNFFLPKGKTEPKEQPEKKMCVLLIEDVDIVFEQDDGFISALAQLVTTSKRPVVMTTTDSNSVSIQKFISQYEYIPFLPLSRQTLATWLQIVCLVEGLFVDQGDIGSLLEYNRGDVRKTLLELQFWVQSGGEITRDDVQVKIRTDCAGTEEILVDDEQPLCWVKDHSKTGDVVTHSNCINSFEIFRDHKPYRIPYYINLGLLWWNMPSILNMPDCSQDRFNKFKDNESVIEIEDSSSSLNKSDGDRKRMVSAAQLYDSLAITDVLFRKVNYYDGSEPVVKNYSCEVKDSLELGERMETFTDHSDFYHEVTHCLVNGYVEQYNGAEEGELNLNMAVPERTERRWRAKQHVCEDVFQEALSLSSYVERKSVALDYMPTLRTISRSERHRAANNTKRGNRFRNYLRNLGINYNDNTLKLACNILTTNDGYK